MSTYVNNTPLQELLANVEMQSNPETRLQMIRSLEAEFSSLAVTALERVAYDLAERGWTVRQIADEIGVSRTYISAMAAAFASRTGRLSPFPSTRSYDHAVDISRLVGREARRRAADPPQP